MTKLPRLPRLNSADKGTTAIGFVSRKAMTVVRKTSKSGNDHNQVVYVLRCKNGHEFGANGSDIHLRVCPYCDPRAKGLDLLIKG